MKIGTHDSVTGEKGLWWTWPLIPFARTQGKTLVGQLEAGCRLFDIRVRRVAGEWRGAHGLWCTRKPVFDLLDSLAKEAGRMGVTVSIMLTYEGSYRRAADFLEFVDNELCFLRHRECVKLGPVSAKYGRDSRGLKVCYDVLRDGDPDWLDGGTKQCFLPLDGSSWHTYLPVPLLWKLFYFRRVEFDDSVYRFVDFL